jgi:hypothetical protein
MGIEGSDESGFFDVNCDNLGWMLGIWVPGMEWEFSIVPEGIRRINGQSIWLSSSLFSFPKST